MPAVDGKQPAARDGDGRWYAEVGERVGGHVSDGRVGGELEHHDDILLHLILKHQRALGKETLVRQTEKDEGERGGEWGRRARERKNRWDRGREGRRCISGSKGSEQVHTLRAALGEER